MNMKTLKITGNGMPRSTRVYLDEIEIPVRAVSIRLSTNTIPCITLELSSFIDLSSFDLSGPVSLILEVGE